MPSTAVRAGHGAGEPAAERLGGAGGGGGRGGAGVVLAAASGAARPAGGGHAAGRAAPRRLPRAPLRRLPRSATRQRQPTPALAARRAASAQGPRQPRRVWLLGTSHAAAASAAHVERVLRAVRPSQRRQQQQRQQQQQRRRRRPRQRRRLAEYRRGELRGGAGAVGAPGRLAGAAAAAGPGRVRGRRRAASAGAGPRPDATRRACRLHPRRVLLKPPRPSSRSAASAGLRRGRSRARSWCARASWPRSWARRCAPTAPPPVARPWRRADAAAGVLGRAQVVLGDRPIQITMQRAWGALSAAEKWALLRALLQLKRGGTGEELQQLALDLPSDAGVVSQVRRCASPFSP
eukprot:scaffold1127_cov361-Prasinococcus_capsulatus_cf.AAC.12